MSLESVFCSFCLCSLNGIIIFLLKKRKRTDWSRIFLFSLISPRYAIHNRWQRSNRWRHLHYYYHHQRRQRNSGRPHRMPNHCFEMTLNWCSLLFRRVDIPEECQTGKGMLSTSVFLIFPRFCYAFGPHSGKNKERNSIATERSG